MEARVRLQNEFINFQKQRPFGFYARPEPNNIFFWKCQIHHCGYFFSLTMSFSKDYPIRPPDIKFEQPVFHPNVYSDKSVCLDIIGGKWSPSMTIKDILIGLRQLFDSPNPNSPAAQQPASLYVHDRNAYDEKVRNCNEKHHKLYKTIL